jgi:hypothetical protein
MIILAEPLFQQVRLRINLLYNPTMVKAETPRSEPGSWHENYVVRRLASSAASGGEQRDLHSRSTA